MQQITATAPTIKVVQSSYDFHNERFLCRCQTRQFSASLHDEYVPLDELRTFCAQKDKLADMVDEGMTLQEWMQRMKPTGINAIMTAVLHQRFALTTE